MSFLLLLTAALLAEDWTRFRGPNGSGIAADKGYPVEFGPAKNLVWRTPARPGKSSPILTKKHIFLTSYDDNKLFTECFDRATGKRLWEKHVPRARTEIHNRLNHPAAVTPVTDGENVYAFFKDYGMVSYDSTGRERWRAPLGPFHNSMGLGSSPVIYGNHVVLVADQLQDSYIAAFDRANGEIRWKTDREESEGWGTPLTFTASEPLILTVSRGQFGAYNKAGKRIATMRNLGTAVVGSPILHNNMLYVFGYGGDTPAPFSTRTSKLDKNSDGKLTQDEYADDPFLHGIAKFSGNRDMIITEDEWDQKQREVGGPTALTALRLERTPTGVEATEVWRVDKGFNGVIPTSILVGDVLYVVKNGGILTSYDAATGKVHKTARLTGAISGYSSSPVSAEGRVYFGSEDGKVSVLRSAADWEILQVNDIGEPIYATPALSEGAIYLRTDNALSRFQSAR
ncbi:MAG: PQQ-binding-like beta-propeller repeat protein [Bryobacterales bacterium]|nr:PQQ-binding-like beta-propeller repeat protein [Bryobacterales bacterium]